MIANTYVLQKKNLLINPNLAFMTLSVTSKILNTFFSKSLVDTNTLKKSQPLNILATNIGTLPQLKETNFNSMVIENSLYYSTQPIVKLQEIIVSFYKIQPLNCVIQYLTQIYRILILLNLTNC
jgi:hypothetical protein